MILLLIIIPLSLNIGLFFNLVKQEVNRTYVYYINRIQDVKRGKHMKEFFTIFKS